MYASDAANAFVVIGLGTQFDRGVEIDARGFRFQTDHSEINVPLSAVPHNSMLIALPGRPIVVLQMEKGDAVKIIRSIRSSADENTSNIKVLLASTSGSLKEKIASTVIGYQEPPSELESHRN